MISLMFLNRQGCYSNEGDIVVLCAYLGQLARLRDALAHDVAVLIDERDQAALTDQESEQEQDVIGGPTIERLNVTKRVRAYFLMICDLLWINLRQRSVSGLWTIIRAKKAG